MDHRRNRLCQPVPGARAGGQRGRAVSDDLGAGLGVYGVQISASHVRMIGGQMVQMLLKLGLVETATSLVAGIFKSSLVGYAAAGAVQGVSMAYLTHVSGETFAEYFRQRPDLGRRRDAGSPRPPVRPHQPRRVPSGVRQAGGPESVEPTSPGAAEESRAGGGQDLSRDRGRSTVPQAEQLFPRLVPEPDDTIVGAGRASARRRTSCTGILAALPRAHRSMGAGGPRVGGGGPRSGASSRRIGRTTSWATASIAGRCMESRSASRTSSTSPDCRRRAGPSAGPSGLPNSTPMSSPGFATPGR